MTAASCACAAVAGATKAEPPVVLLAKTSRTATWRAAITG
jgi:hypothetical protein